MSSQVRPTRSRVDILAESSPRIVLQNGEFWKQQWRFILLGIVSFLALLLLFPYTYQPGQGGWVLLTFFVHCIAFWGFFVTAFALAKIEIEIAIVKRVERGGEEYLSRVKGGERSLLELDRLEEGLLPNNTSNPLPASLRLFQHIFREARDRKFESSVNVMEPYREESLSEIFKLQNLQKIALWLGILGTFVGLLLAIQVGGLSELQPQSGGDFVNVVNKMFDGLRVAFSASLAGLEAAIIIGFCLLLLRRRQGEYFQGMEQSVVTVFSTARHAINKDELLSELSQVTSELRSARTSFTAGFRNVSTEISALQRQIITQNEHLQNGLKGLAIANTEFETFRNDVREKQAEVIEEMVQSVDPISLRTSIKESIAEAGQHLSATVSPSVSQISIKLGLFNESILVLKGVLEGQAAVIDRNLGRFESQVKEQMSRNTDAIRDMNARVQSVAARVEEARRGLGRQRTSIAQSEISVREWFRRLRW